MRNFNRLFEAEITTSKNTVKFPEDLKYEFKINNLETRPGQCMLRVFNAAQSSLGQVYEGALLELRAGYADEGQPKTIFKGQVSNYFQFRQGPDVITEIYAADWGTAFQADSNEYSYSESDTLQHIVTEVAKLMKTTIKPKKGTGGVETVVAVSVDDNNIQLSTTGAGQSKPSGTQIPIGTCSNYLNKLAKQYNFTWWIRNGIFYTSPDGEERTGTADAVNISAAEGLISTPIITSKGVDVITLMNPTLTIGSLYRPHVGRSTINIANKYYAPLESFKQQDSWIQRVHELVHKGDTRGNQWQTELTGMHVQ